MGIYVDIIANETTARTSETQMLAGNTATAGKYYPKFKGKLVKVRIKCTPQAATSLCQAGYVKLIQEDWDPNTIIFAFNGFGLATAPQDGYVTVGQTFADGAQRGQTYVVMYISQGYNPGDVRAPIAKGYVYASVPLALGQQVEPGPAGGHGYRTPRTTTNPAAGAEV